MCIVDIKKKKVVKQRWGSAGLRQTKEQFGAGGKLEAQYFVHTCDAIRMHKVVRTFCCCIVIYHTH